MTRTMYDGVTASRLPAGAQMVAGYVDGRYKWSDADWRRFSPQTVRVRIAVFATTNDGHVLDCEPGNCTPAQSVDWALMRRRAGVDPTVYCNQLDETTGWPAVRAAFRARGVPEPHYWVAKYDGVQSIPAGAIGKQYEDDETHGWDRSVIADHWPGIDPPQEADMPLTTQDVKAVADEVLGRLLPRGGAGAAGNTTLGGMVVWNDAHVQSIINAVNSVKDAVAKPPAPVDVKALAAAVVTGITPIVAQAVTAGVQPDYDHMAAVLEARLGVALTAGAEAK